MDDLLELDIDYLKFHKGKLLQADRLDSKKFISLKRCYIFNLIQ